MLSRKFPITSPHLAPLPTHSYFLSLAFPCTRKVVLHEPGNGVPLGGILSSCLQVSPDQWFSTSLMLWPFNTGPHVGDSQPKLIFLLLLHSCNFATVMSHNVNVCLLMVLGDLCEKVVCDPQVENHVSK
uniref:Uncharacterized protein n=1 Tax=Mus musculus TaxID=10090 RepID=Q8CCD7_MOUSE|nr:unnamed protein product [Mus musculus]